MTDPADFGLRLRRQRELRGVSLQHIADDTKINSSLLADLERGDLSRWPAGIFGRAFIRSYAEAVGLEAGQVLTEFVRLLPPDEGLPVPSPGPDQEPLLPGWTFKGSETRLGPVGSHAGGPIRLTLAEPETAARVRLRRVLRPLAAVVVDSALLVAGAAIGVLVVGSSGWLVGLAISAVAVVVAASTVLGTTPGRRLLNPPTHLRPVRPNRRRLTPPRVGPGDSSASEAGAPQILS
jgi:transcriptional regulator with XRE-family HTH domain